MLPRADDQERLRVFQPNDANSYLTSRELGPVDMLPEVNKAQIVITNYHAFRLRELREISKGERRLMQGGVGPALQDSRETERLMLQWVIKE
jgi:type III restriction enzyme